MVSALLNSNFLAYSQFSICLGIVFIATNSILLVKIRLPWFRVHIVILNDPGRLISVHIMHSGFAAGWSGVMVLYELITVDPTDPVYNPIWRQGCYVIPFISRIGLYFGIGHIGI